MLKSKPCKEYSCSNPIWGGGYCKNHQNLRIDKKTKEFKKVNQKPLKNSRKSKDPLVKKADWEFYLEIWDERPHFCEISGKYLGEEALTTMFHHILPKAKFPQYRYEKWNIALLLPAVHSQVEEFIDKVPEMKERYEQLLKKVQEK